MKPPPMNDSKEAIILRVCALEFVKRAGDGVWDEHDTAGQRRNRKLLEAALAYAAVVNGTGHAKGGSE